MKFSTRLLTAALFCLFAVPVFSQNILITFQKSDSLFVCGTDTFFVSVQNLSTTAITGAALNLELPSGLAYLPGTISGAAEQNIGNLQQPVFTLPGLAPGATAQVAVLLSADCLAADALDAGELFIANISVESSAGNASVLTSSIAVETGLILIESIEDELLAGEKGDTLLRTICVKNTRLGKIGNLHFEDEHGPGFEVVDVSGSMGQSHSPTLSTAEFDGGFFTQFGDGDVWLELGETVCFSEKIAITDCGIPEFTSPSMLRVGWGCGGEVCRYDSALVNIDIKKSTKVPDLVFEQIWDPPTDYCGNTPVVMGLKIKNIGALNATEIFVGISLLDNLGNLDNRDEIGVNGNSFRIVRNGIATPLPPNLVVPDTLVLCDLPVVSGASLVVPMIASNDSILLLFDTYTCEQSCSQVVPYFIVEYFYRKPCPVNGFVSDTLAIGPDGQYILRSFVGFEVSACLQSGESYPFHYAVGTTRLVEDEGFLNLELNLPHGLSFDDSCATLLGGVAPNVSTVTPLAGGGSTVHLAWELPLPFDTVEMDFCLRYVCDTNIDCKNEIQPPDGSVVIYSSDCPTTCFLRMGSRTWWSPALDTPYECGIGDCDSLQMVVDIGCNPNGPGEGGGDTLVIDTIFPLPGLTKWFSVYRLNLGFQDDDDDRHADNLLPPSSENALVRRDRFLPGDTLRVEYCGAVDSGGGLFQFGRTIWHEIVSSDLLSQDNDLFLLQGARTTFSNANKFRFVRDSIRIRYADGTEARCALDDLKGIDDQNFFAVNQVNTWPPANIDNISTQRFRFTFSLQDLFEDGCLPKGTLDLGDSIFVYTDFKIDLNYRPNSSNNPDPPLVGFRTALSEGGLTYAYNFQPFKKLQYSGIRTTRSANQHSIRACENSLEPKKFRQMLRIARENMFPYEVRPIAHISEYWQTVPDGLEVLSTKLEYLTLQDSVPFLNNLNLPFTQSPGRLDVDFDPVFADPVDEGFTLRTSIIFKPDCLYDKPDSSRQYITMRYNPGYDSTTVVTDSIINAIGFFSNAPDLRLETGDSLVIAPSKVFDVDFILKNYVVSPAFNSWVSVVSMSGNASNFELFNLPQNQPIVSQNGIFQTGSITGFNQLGFRLKGQNVACEPDTLRVIFGWDCAPVSSLDQATCGRDTYLIELRLQTPELELDILSEPASIALCDTSDYFEFEIYNAKIGYAYEPFATVRLPPGLVIMPGTCQIAYPTDGAFAPITDPVLLPGNLYQWAVADLQLLIAANGLPGVDLDPQNAFRIRFRVLAECGFVSNSPIIYGTRGTEPCGRASNMLNKPGEPVIINGLNPTYGVIVNLQPTGNPAEFCGGTQQFLVKLTLLGAPSPGDSVYVLLPQGVSYTADSYLPIQNAPAGPPDLDGSVFRLPLPTNVGTGSVVEFRFSVRFDQSAGCIDQILLVQTRVRSEAFCQTLGAPCTVYVSTGEAIWNINLQHPELSIGGAGAVIVGNQINTTISVNNIGTVPAPGVTAQIWHDVDGNGVISATDVLLATVENGQTLAPGDSLGLAANLNIDPALLCDLLVVLPAAENCICADQVLPLNNIALQYERKEYCEIQTVTVGVAEQSGFTYQWLTPNGIFCTTCATTDFTPVPPPLPGQPVVLILEEKSADCTVLHRFELTFGNAASLSVNNPTICKGETATLTANPPGEMYAWSGSGIVNPALQSQTVMPVLTANYEVTVTFSNGCTAVLMAPIHVAQPDTTLLPGLITCEGEPVDVLGNTTDTPGTYSLPLQNASGCDSIIYQNLSVLPRPLTEENFAFCTGDTLFVLDTLLTQSGQLCRSYLAANGCDSLYCVNATTFTLPPVSDPDTIFATIGQPVVLTGPGGYVTYTWIPAVPNCPNCPSVTITPDSAYTEYQLFVTDANGCGGLVTFRILTFPPCDAQRLRIPNAFTPNGDAINDVFRVVPFEGLEIIGSLTIYDRWGEKVYENQGNVFWDGSINGKPGPSDVYVYRIDIICDGKPEAVWGDVALLR